MDNLKGKELKSSHWEGRLEVLPLSRMHTQVKTSVVPWEMEMPWLLFVTPLVSLTATDITLYCNGQKFVWDPTYKAGM